MRASVPGFAFFFILFSLTHATVWDFGTDTPKSEVLNDYTGTMGILESSKTIVLNVPLCYTVTHVRVQVDNLLSTPAVSYNRRLETVTIKYSFLQLRVSTFHVVVKAEYTCKRRNDETATDAP